MYRFLTTIQQLYNKKKVFLGIIHDQIQQNWNSLIKKYEYVAIKSRQNTYIDLCNFIFGYGVSVL